MKWFEGQPTASGFYWIMENGEPVVCEVVMRKRGDGAFSVRFTNGGDPIDSWELCGVETWYGPLAPPPRGKIIPPQGGSGTAPPQGGSRQSTMEVDGVHC